MSAEALSRSLQFCQGEGVPRVVEGPGAGQEGGQVHLDKGPVLHLNYLLQIFNCYFSHYLNSAEIKTIC